ncbi:uncharacterized protein LOC119658205 [Hermetia illucens]|uniref:uncharacterized protein LOC119658205 n=1 Tax=Hermetia illucens TaxID=343691 RepID=UPI0018CC66D3|nr:uncharacterized protein LOC119658205 [Hermetia illucens]
MQYNFHVVEKLKDAKIRQHEILVSFDVEALFPSISVKQALQNFETWLNKHRTSTKEKRENRQYTKLASICMSENYFTFRSEYYKTTAGTAMGNPLSPLLSEMFMAGLEELMEQRGITPTFWDRYVDEVLAIVDKSLLNGLLEKTNQLHKNIVFTMETDIKIIRNEEDFEFDIFRKPTTTQRVTSSSSFHSYQHRFLVFHSMVHRMLNIPLTRSRYIKELAYIKDTAKKNGHSTYIIDAMMRKKQAANNRKRWTSFAGINDKTTVRSSITCTSLWPRINNALKGFKIEAVPTSRHVQLKTRLRSVKDPKSKEEESGIYKITCPKCSSIDRAG